MDHKAYSPRRELAALLSSAGVVAALTVAPTFAIAEEAPAVTGESSETAALVTDSAAEGQGSQSVEDEQGIVVNESVSSAGTGVSVASASVPSVDSASYTAEEETVGDDEPSNGTSNIDDLSSEDEDDSTADTKETDSSTTPSTGEETDGNEPTEEEPTIPGKTVENGTYVIESAKSDKQVVDAANGSKANGTNVQSYESNMTGSQKWGLSYDEKTGYYTVSLSGTSQVLDVANGSAKDGANVQIYKSNGSDAQLWLVQENGNGTYTLFSKLRSDLALTIDSSSISNGTNICLRVYVASNKAQQFYFLTTNPSVAASDVELPNGEGAYTVTPSSDGGYALDIASGSSANGANVQVYKSNSTNAQKLYFKSDGKGFYTIYIEGTGKVLDAAKGNLVSGTNVQQWESTGADNQKWALRKNVDENGEITPYSIVNKANGLLLDISGGTVKNSANIQVYRSNNTAAQKFKLVWLNSKVTGTEFTGTGTYIIESGTSDFQVLDVANGSTSNGANVQTYESNMSSAQKWLLSRDASTGYYTISLAGNTNMVLDVSSGSFADGANVQLWKKNNSLAQRWKVYKSGDQVIIVSALRNDFALDLASAGKSNGTNVQAYTANGSSAQKFYLVNTKVNVAATSAEVQANFSGAAYVISPSKYSGYAIDVASGSTSNGANVQVYAKNGTSAQRLYIRPDGNGYYYITVIGSAKSLDVAGGNLVSGTNVQQWATYNGDNQKWAIRDNGDGSYSFINKATGLLLYMSGGKASNGANIQGYRDNKSAAQKFKLTETSILTEGIYQISSLLDLNQVLDVKSGSSSSGAGLQAYTSNGTLAQRYQVVYDSATGTYRIRTAASGGWITANSTGSVTQSGSSTTAASNSNKWKVVWNGTYFSLANAGSGKVLDLKGGSASNGTALQTYTANGTDAQHFLFQAAQLIANGLYEIHSGINNGLNIDVAGGSSSSGANIQLWTDNGENAQKFYITLSGNGYVIKNVSSGLALDVENGSKANSANVRQWSANGSKAQLWEAQIADGGYVIFVNANSGKVLDVSGGGNYAGANVDQYAANGTAAQKWRIEKTQVYGWLYENGSWYFYYKDGSSKQFVEAAKISYDRWMASNTLNSGEYTPEYMVTVDQLRFYTCIHKRNSEGKWEPLYAWLCGTGRDGKTSNGYYEITGRHDYTEGTDEWGRQYYYTEFLYYKQDELGQCFHSLVYINGSVGEDGRGGKASAGCVRLDISQAKWIYDNLPAGVFVWIYEY